MSPSLVKSGRQQGGQAQLQRMDEPRRHVLCHGTELKDGKNLGAGIKGQPGSAHLFGTAETGAQFVQLEMREGEMEEEPLMQCVAGAPALESQMVRAA